MNSLQSSVAYHLREIALRPIEIVNRRSPIKQYIREYTNYIELIMLCIIGIIYSIQNIFFLLVILSKSQAEKIEPFK